MIRDRTRRVLRVVGVYLAIVLGLVVANALRAQPLPNMAAPITGATIGALVVVVLFILRHRN